MRSDSVEVAELKRIQERWLKLRDEFPRVWHCCAVQTGPVRVEGEWLRDGSTCWSDRTTLGAIKTTVLGTGIPGEPIERFDCDLPDVALPKRVKSGLDLSLWGELFSVLVTTGTAPMAVFFRGQSERMAMPGGSPDWFGRCDFAEGWPTPINFQIIPGVFHALARDSVAFTDPLLSHPHLRVTAFNRWLSEVYRILGVPDDAPQEARILMEDLQHGDREVLSIENRDLVIPDGSILRLWARIPLRGVYLPSDVCTASVKAIESLLAASDRWSGVPGSVGQAKENQYVTLDQMAALVNRSKKTLERWYLKGTSKGKLPEPDVEGGGGNSHEWIWSRVREPLGNLSGKIMPELYPNFRETRQTR